MDVKRGTHKKLGCIIVIVGTIIVWSIITYLIFGYRYI
jgi:hypothetical protein